MDIADEVLADRAALIAEVVVLGKDAAPVPDRPATDYLVRIETVLKGEVPGSVVVVRAPGGRGANGLALTVWGVPLLKTGDRAVLFLEPAGDAAYSFVELSLGVFLRISSKGQELLVRDLRELRYLPAAGLQGEVAAPQERLRERERFISWLSARAQGLAKAADYFATLQPIQARGVYQLVDQRGLQSRRVSSDVQDTHLRDWFVEQGVASRPSLMRSVWTALESWELAPQEGASVRLAGAVGSPGGLARYDEANTVVLTAPSRQGTLFSPETCPPRGIISVSGTWSRPGSSSAIGLEGGAVLGADVELLVDAECLSVMTASTPAGVGNDLSVSARLEAGSEAELLSERFQSPDSASSGSRVQPLEPGASSRGYEGVACSFDMDDDLIYGEPNDDCNVCDGLTTDVDGDGQDEDLIYVDCDSGTDTASCGSAASPCATIQYALNTVADGPLTGQEDIICFTGTCAEDETTIGLSGKSGTKLRPQSGSEARAFEYPTNPAMIVGWDTDNDGEYPPYDTDDNSELYGGAPWCFGRAFKMATSKAQSFLELAHFTARDYGTCDAGDAGGFLYHRTLQPSTSTHHYFHDLELDGLNKGRHGVSGRIVWDLFLGDSTIKWFSWENLDIKDSGGFAWRGEADSLTSSGPLRFRRLSHRCLSGETGIAGGTQCTGWKLWGYFDGIEILDSHYDMNTSAFAVQQNVSSAFADAAQCSRDWTIRNNWITDYRTGFIVQGSASGSCDTRTVDDATLDRNFYINDYDWGSQGWNGSSFFRISNCETVVNTVEDVTVTNNIAYTAYGSSELVSLACSLNDSGPNPGQIVFANNTLYSGGDVPFGAIQELCDTCDNPPCAYAENILFKNNIIQVPAGEEAMNFKCAPDGFLNDHNVYSPGTALVWDGVPRTWSEWQQMTQGDGQAKVCNASFVDAGTGELHLIETDSCAVDEGETLSGLTNVDVDGDPRGAGGSWDIGADEVGLFLLEISKEGVADGVVSSEPNGIECGGDCSEQYGAGNLVSLVAVPELGGEFGGWSGDSDCSDGVVEMNTDRSCTATFNTCSISSEVQLDATSEPIDVVISFEACNVLRAGAGGFEIGSGGEVTFRAGNLIELQDGFVVEAGGALHATIGPP